MIIGFSVVILGLSGVAAYDINNYFNNRQEISAHKNCKKYLNNGNYDLYQQCCELVIRSFE